MKRLVASLTLAFACTWPALAGAQTAHQGVPGGNDAFRSPMVLETPIATFDDASQRIPPWRMLGDTTTLSRFVCEGISVPHLSVKASEKIDKEEMRAVEIALTLLSARHEDKDVDVLIELLREGQVVATTHLPAVEVEEGSRTSRQVRWKVRSRDIDSKPGNLIRVTVSVVGTDSAAPPPFVAAPAPAAISPSPRTETAEPVGAGSAVACRTLISESSFDKTYYTTLKEISVSKKFYGSVEEMYEPLAEKARKIGADAVIDVHVWHAASGFAWAAPHAGGMAVRWTEAGRSALHGFPGRCY